MTKEHTPTPWIVDTVTYGDIWIVADKESWVPRICHIPDYSEANAAHIVKCVNMHDELVEALKQAYAVCRAHDYFDSDIEDALKKAGAL